MVARDIPLHVFHFDCFWMKEFNWCDLQWDPRFFPDPEGMLARLKSRGLRICVWINPYIAQRSILFDEALQEGYLLRRPNGDTWQWDMWQAGMGIVDFTNPDACKWFAEKLRGLLKMGVDTFKTDFGERIPSEGVVYHDGSDPVEMHNLYALKYNEVVFDLLRELNDEELVLRLREPQRGEAEGVAAEPARAPVPVGVAPTSRSRCCGRPTRSAPPSARPCRSTSGCPSYPPSSGSTRGCSSASRSL